ncbi:MAG: hypothetical protein GTO08_03635 [Deltaproteobacteria bacterium]|nr:hypothetical protein [Deltaproteobacteria bacterium]
MNQKSGNPVYRFLRQRGLSVCQAEPFEKTIHNHIKKSLQREEFNRHFASYSYRIFIRDLLAIRHHISPDSFGLFIERDRAENYLELSEKLSLLEKDSDGQYTFSLKDVTDIGDTFEYFVAQILRNMDFDAVWGVKFEGISSGGDFDVIGLAAGKLFYIEAKTSPPKHVEAGEISNFFERFISLRPDLGILLNDTHLRMKDKLVPLIEEEVEKRRGSRARMERLEREIFSLNGRIFVANTKRDIGVNLKICFDHFFYQDWKGTVPFPL